MVEDAALASTPVAEEDLQDKIPERDQRLPRQKSSISELCSFHNLTLSVITFFTILYFPFYPFCLNSCDSLFLTSLVLPEEGFTINPN